MRINFCIDEIRIGSPQCYDWHEMTVSASFPAVPLRSWDEAGMAYGIWRCYLAAHSFKRLAISFSVIGVPSSAHTAFSSSTVMLPDLYEGEEEDKQTKYHIVERKRSWNRSSTKTNEFYSVCLCIRTRSNSFSMQALVHMTAWEEGIEMLIWAT